MDIQPRVTPYLSLSQTTSITLLSTLSYRDGGFSDPNESTSTSAPPSPVFSLDRSDSHSPLTLHTLTILLQEDQEDTLPLVLPLVNPLHLVVRRLSSTPHLPSSSDIAVRAAFTLSPAWDRILSVEMKSCLLLTTGETRTLFPASSNRHVETLVDFSRWGDGEGGQETLDLVASALQALSFEPWRVVEGEGEEGEGREKTSLRFLVGNDEWKTWLDYELGLLELGEETMSQIEVVVR